MIDRKFKILAVNPCKGSVYTEKDGVFFCAKDIAFLTGALPGYRKACKALDCGAEHIESIDLMIERVAKFQKIESKVPDTETDCEIDRCIGGNIPD